LRFWRCVLMLVWLAATAWARDPAPTPRVAVVETQAVEPRVDGELDDPCWQQACRLTDWVLSDSGYRASLPVEGRVLLTPQHLYVAYRCWEPDPSLLRTRATSDGDEVQRDDALEVYLSPFPTGSQPQILHLMVTSRGARVIETLTPETDTRQIVTACKLLPDGWQAEVAIPLSATGITRLGPDVGWEWRFNLNRQRRTTTRLAEDYNWSYMHDRWEVVDYLGILRANPHSPLVVTAWNTPPARWGQGNQCSLHLRARQRCEAALVCRTQAGATAARTRLRAGETGRLTGLYTTRATGTPLNRELLTMNLAVEGKPAFGLRVPVWTPAPAQLFLEEPNYRGFLWPETRQVRGFLELGLTPAALAGIRFDLSLEAPGTAPIPARCRLQGERLQFAADASRLGPGPARLVVRGADRESGQVLLEQAMDLRRLTEAERQALPAYIDPYQRLIVAGKPFFPLGWYGGHNPSQLEEVAQGGFNCMLDYGINSLELDQIRAYLDRAQELGMHLIYCNNDLYPTAVRSRTKGAWQGKQIVEGIVDTFKDHPALIAWYLNDELPTALIPELTDYYQRIAAHDPGHPAYIVLCDMTALPQFAGTTDVMGVDPYPIPGEIKAVASQADIARRGTREVKPAWLVLQAFAWYQYGEPPAGAVGGRGRIPTMQELRSGREPTFEEERAMSYLALNHGAKGIIYYCYYDHRVLPLYQQRFEGMKRLAAEINELMPVLLTTEQVPRNPFSCSHPAIDLGVWKYQGHYYLAAVNTTRDEQLATIRGPFGRPVEVLFEQGRQAAPRRGRLTELFPPLQVHVYRLP